MSIRSRAEFEALEDKILAPYAMKSKDSAGREYDEPIHEMRTCYQRDRDRILHSAAFRKLEYKTQVFVILEGDYYRTRLTHSLEVAQIGRTIGRSLRLNEDLIEAVALAHDLGHPPFGHAGEEALNNIMKESSGFNHNKHSFDIVTKYEKRYPEFDGLNLTREVLVGILKHETVYDQGGAHKKYSEGPTLEAKVVDAADSLAYLTHDIDDGLTSGCLDERDLLESGLWKRAYKKAEEATRFYDKEMRKYQVVKNLVDMQTRDLVAATGERLAKLKFSSFRQARDYKGACVGYSREMQRERDILQESLNKKLYHHYRVVRMTEKAKRIISDLFQAYLKQPNQLPYSVYARDKRYSLKEKFVVIGYHIASMTDRFALEEHKKLFNPYYKV